MLTLRLYMAQRLTALIMAPLTIGHLVVMIYACLLYTSDAADE